jgi:putative transposase
LLKTDQAKDILKDCLFRIQEKFGWMNMEWSIMNNHYHFMARVPKGNDIPKMINTLHKTSAYHIKRNLNIQVEPFWYQYWDRCIRDEDHYLKTANYIIFNPLKHGVTDDIRKYPYSSYGQHYNAGVSSMNGFEQLNSAEIIEFKDLDDF